MQFLRNLTWWFIGLTTLIVFTLVLLISRLLNGQFWQVPHGAIIALYVGLILGFLNRIRFFRLGETLVHEIGHAQMAALTFGRISFIRVERDTSGVTFHRPGFIFTRITSALVSLFGPISSSVFFVITARLIASELTGYWALGVGIFIGLILITTVRNLWGWITGLIILGILYLALEASGLIVPQLLTPNRLVATNAVMVEIILGTVAFNVGSALQYSLACRKAQNPNSDEYKFSRSLFLPGFLGGHLIIAIQLFLTWVGLSYVLGWHSIFQVGRLI